MNGTYCIPDAHGRCLTCSDDAQPVTVLAVKDSEGLALVEVDGQQMEVDISLIEDVATGQILLVHGGVALERLDTERQAESK